MFCKICGKKNNPDSLYCSYDGVKLDRVEDSRVINKGNHSFCNDCGNKTSKKDAYCSNCGQSLHKIDELEVKSKKMPGREVDLMKFDLAGSKVLALDNQSLVKYGLGASGIIILISIILGMLINSGFSELVALELGPNMDIKLMRLLDMLPIINGGSMDISGIFMGEDIGILATRGMFIMLLIIPILVFTILGAFLARKAEKDSLIRDYFLLALGYGLIISVLSIFARASININAPYGDYKLIDISKNFSMINLIFRGFIISFASMNFGEGISNFISGFRDKKLGALEIGSMILAISIVYSLIGGLVFIEDDLLDLGRGDTMSELLNMMTKGQLSIFSLVMMNMGKASMIGEGHIDSFSIFKSADISSKLVINLTYIYLGLFISLALFLFYGRWAKKEGKTLEDLVATVAIFALGVTIIGYLATINMDIDRMQYLTYKSNHIRTFIGSLGLAGLAALAGYLLAADRTGVDRDV